MIKTRLLFSTLVALLIASNGFGQALTWVTEDLVLGPDADVDLVDLNGDPIPQGAMWAVMMFIDDEQDLGASPDFSGFNPNLAIVSPGDDAPAFSTLQAAVATTGANGDLFHFFVDADAEVPEVLNQHVFTVIFNDPDPTIATAFAIVEGRDQFNGFATQPTIVIPDLGIGGANFDYILANIDANDWVVVPEPTTVAMFGLGFVFLVVKRVRDRKRN